MAKTALLILDVQNELVDPRGKVGREGFARVVEERALIPRIATVLTTVRERGFPVAFVNVGFRADYADAISRSARLQRLRKLNAIVAGTWATDFPEAIAPLPSEIVYTKRAVNPFFNTGLESWLHRNGVDTVALCGVYTHMVVDSAARHADDAGLHVRVLEDCCASPDPELHRVEVEKILPLFGQVISSAEFLGGL
jgi:biuret amidohydrolase